MVERKQVALLFSYSEEWIGGTYYILNLILSLKTLDDELMPDITIITDSVQNYDKVVELTTYPYLNYELTTSDPIEKTFDIVFPNPCRDHFTELKNGVSWLTDLQVVHLPHFFSESDVKARRARLQRLAEKANHLVFSSENALGDFEQLYPASRPQLHVLPFAVTHPEYESLDVAQLREKFGLPVKFFFCPNQFWAHKNHSVVLKAVALLKKRGIEVVVAFSGKESDHRNPGYFESLVRLVEENDLKDNVSFLGFIDRREQLQLMNNALAVIQPSLFEGWSTVVEDAKAMNQFIIVSDLPVHREQLSDNCSFFDPYSPECLADLISDYICAGNRTQVPFDYAKERYRVAEDFMKIVGMVCDG